MSEEPTPGTPPEGVEREETDDSSTARADAREASQLSGDAEVLLIEECAPWETSANQEVLDELEASYEVVGWAGLSTADFGAYSVVLLASTQWTGIYETLEDRRADLEAFVEAGGVFVAHAMNVGWPCWAGEAPDYSYLPSGVETRNRSEPPWQITPQEASITAPEHPLVEGVEAAEFGEQDIYFKYFEGLPEEATVLIESVEHERAICVEYDHGDGLVIATGSGFEWPWAEDGVGGIQTKVLLRNELEYALADESDPPRTVSASVTTLQFIPGEEENPSRGGHPLNSGLMQIIPGEGGEISIPWTDTSVGMYPMFDSWIGGDMRDDIPETLEEARKPKDAKYIDDAGTEPFNEYRFENGVNVSFETTEDSSVDKDTIEIQFNESGPSGDDPLLARGDQENSRTVLHDHEVNTIPWRDWYDEESVKSSRRQPRYYEYDTDFEFEGVEGVRVFTVWGGWAAFMDDLSDRVSENAAIFFSELWGWPVPETLAKAALAAAPVEVQFAIDSMAVVPNTYSVLDLIVLADGRRYVRVWDASEYPSLAIYVDEYLQELEEMPYEPRELFNRDMFAFTVHAMAGVTPYQSLTLRYFKSHLRNEPAIRNDLEETLIEFVRLLDLPWGAHELMPSIPRETLAFDATGEPLDDADAPFGTGVIMKPWSRLESR